MKLFYTELIKLKNTFALWLTILGALFMPLLLLSAYLLSEKEFIPAIGVNPWYEYLLRTFNGSCLLSTGFILLITGLILHVEHKAHSWKHLFTLPVSRTKLYCIKITFIFAMIIVFILLNLVFALFIGSFLGLGRPELKFDAFDIPDKYVSRFLQDFLVSVLPMVVIQYWISIRIENLVTSLGLGLLGLLMGLLFKNSPDSIYFPYAIPFQMWNYQVHMDSAMQKFYWVVAAYLLSFLALSYNDFTRRFKG